MSDVKVLLRRYLEETPPIAIDEITTSPSPGAIPTKDRRAWRSVVARPAPNWAVAVAVAAVTLVAIGGASVLLGGSDGPYEPLAPEEVPTIVPVSTTTTLSVGTEVVGDPSTLAWSRVGTPGLAGPYLYFDGVIPGGPGLIAVGAPADSVGAMIWTSTTGEEWQAAVVDGDGYAYDITAGGPGFVVVGSSVWTSGDGLTWDIVTGVLGGEARAVTRGGPGLVAVGTVNDGPARVWTSEDGRVWSAVTHDDAVFGSWGDDDAEMLDVVRGGPGLVAVGRVGGTAAIWVSDDGLTWSRVPHDPAVFGDGISVGSEMVSVATGSPGLVAVSAIGDTGMGVWTSPDGVTWSRVALDPSVFDGDEELSVVVHTGSGYIAAGLEGDDAAAWHSTDGQTWERLDRIDAIAATGLQGISDIAVVGDSLVAVGWEMRNGRGTEAVWMAEPNRETSSSASAIEESEPDFFTWLGERLTPEEMTEIVQSAYVVHGVADAPGLHTFEGCGASSESDTDVVRYCWWTWDGHESWVDVGSYERGPDPNRPTDYRRHPALDSRIEYDAAIADCEGRDTCLELRVDGRDRVLTYLFRATPAVPLETADDIAFTVLEEILHRMDWLPDR